MKDVITPRILRTILLLIVVFLFSFPAQAQYGGGSGAAHDPYLIYTAKQMNEIGLHEEDWDKHFKLMADIDLSHYTGTEFNIIGINYSLPFTGVFDGNGKKISNFSYTSTDANDIGLFGYVGSWPEKGEIKDLGLIDPNVDAGTGSYVGSLVGCLREATITGCYVEGSSVSGNAGVGGLVGSNFYGTIANCYAQGGSVSGVENVGGLVGDNWHTITNCYATSSVSGNEDVGGLVGENVVTITNCYSAGSVMGDDNVGGLVGTNSSYGTIADCYATSSVVGIEHVGGLVGSGGCAHNSFWDVQTSGQNTSAGGKGRTTAQMQMASTFLGWDECVNEGVWTIDEGNDYPRLWWENKPGEVLDTQQLSDLLTGTGTQDDPYLIYTAEELNVIGVFPCELDKYFKLMADIDLSHYVGTEFNIIGIPSPFTGVFDGNGKKITNLNHTNGLFKHVSGAIRDLGLIDANVDAGKGDQVGSLVGNLQGGTITNCYAQGGSVSGDSSVGGLVGYNSHGTITNCSATGSVTGTGWRVGGLLGRNSGTITNCYSSGDVSGNAGVGGLVGTNGDTITNCYATGSILGNTNVGGLVGWNSWGGTISNCHSSASVSGNEEVGGLAGSNSHTISNCYGTGDVTGQDKIGGLVGLNGSDFWGDGTISNCYSTGSVLGTRDVGGLVGGRRAEAVTNSFWDIKTSGQETSDGGTGKTTAEMQMASTFTDAGWDFVGESVNGTDDIWSICEGTNYPRLVWQIPVGDFLCPDGITIEDFLFFIEHWRDDNCDLSNDYCQGTDLDFSGTVDEADLEILAENWLAGGND